jgi:hypothetical protein
MVVMPRSRIGSRRQGSGGARWRACGNVPSSSERAPPGGRQSRGSEPHQATLPACSGRRWVMFRCQWVAGAYAHRSRRMVWATPSSSLLGTISSAAWSTSGWALATAHAHPEHAKSPRSFGMSPNTTAVLLPLSSKVTSQHYVKVTDAHAIVVGTWASPGPSGGALTAAAAQAGEAVATLTWLCRYPMRSSRPSRPEEVRAACAALRYHANLCSCSASTPA